MAAGNCRNRFLAHTERYGLPSILISFDASTRGFACGDDLGKGSGRSIKGLNLVEALADSEDLLVRFGGHELAAGLTIHRYNIENFRNRINEYAAKHLTEEMLCVCMEADCAVEMSDLTLRLAKEIEEMEPFGTSNPVPNFIITDAVLQRIIPMGNGRHTKLFLEKDGISMCAVWFGMNSAQLPFEVLDRVDVMFQLNINEFQNTTTLQMIVQDMRVNSDFESNLTLQRKRYEEIRDGAEFYAQEDVVPTRDDMAVVFSFLRKEYQLKHTYFPIRRLLGMLNNIQNFKIGFIKLEMIIRIMQELHLCEILEPVEDCFIFDFYFQPTKTSIEKSAVLKKLKTQLHR